MNFTIRDELQFSFDDKDISIRSGTVAKFFKMDRKEMHELIRKLNKKKLFIPEIYYGMITFRYLLSDYLINSKGCNLLLKHIDAPSERKKRFIDLLGINKPKYT